MLNVQEAKQRARVLYNFVAEKSEGTWTLGLSLEAIARLEGHKTWANFLVASREAEADLKARVRVSNDVEKWPVFVFTFDTRAGSYDDALFVMPVGVLLNDDNRKSRWGAWDDEDRVELSSSFKLDRNIVVREVYAHLPLVEEYGLPWYANMDLVQQFCIDELDCAAVEGIESSYVDTGDDTSARYWFEAYVHPDKAKMLMEILEQTTE